MSAVQLGEPLAVFSAVALCDRHEHECVIVSDGQRAYVYTLDGAHVMEDTTVGRVGVTLTATCPVAMAPRNSFGSSEDFDPMQCDGSLVWRLDTEEWTADADARRLLTAYGMGVEQ